MAKAGDIAVAVTKTLMFTDLVDSTRMAEVLGSNRNLEVLRSHDRLARDLLRKYDGVEMKKSDGFLFIFENPINAVRYALAYHSALVHFASSQDAPIACRVGIHVGETFIQENTPEDVMLGAKQLEAEGLSIPVTARIMSLASGWQTLLSQQAFNATRDCNDEFQSFGLIKWVEHGHYLLKGIEDPMAVFEIGIEGVAPLSPPYETDKVRRVGSGLPTILVLPFENLSDESENEFLCDGLTDEIITDLSFLDTLRVISRTAAMQLKGTSRDIDTIRKELNVEYILEGSARATPDRVRITVKLINSITKELAWAGKFSGETQEVFEIQEKISRQVVDALEIKLTAQENQLLAEHSILNIEAYQYYLRARQEIFRFTEDALERALDYLQLGIDIVGDNVQLMSAVGYVHWQYFNIGISTDPSHLEKAQQYAEKCVELDVQAPDGHRLLGLVCIFTGNTQEAFVHLKRALDCNRNDTDALFWLILMSGLVGKSHAVSPFLQRLLKIDPLTPLHQFMAGWISLWDGDFEEATKLIAKSHRMEPGNPVMALVYGQSLAMNGELEASFETFESLAQVSPDSPFAGLGMFLKLALEGQRDEALAVVDEDLEGFSTGDPEWSWTLAQGYAVAGDKDKAFEWLTGAVEAGLINYPFLAERDPLLQNIRGEAMFAPLMDKAQAKWRAFKA